MLWEVPAGSAEPGEELEDGARRELREETGYVAGRIRPIGSLLMSPGFCGGHALLLRRRLTAGATAFDEDERIENGVFSSSAAWRLVAPGTADVKTVLALFWLRGGEKS